VAVQHLGQSLAWITLIAVLLTCSHVPDGRTQGNTAPPAPGEEAPSPPSPAPSTGVLFGRVTAMAPPGPGEGGVPGPVP